MKRSTQNMLYHLLPVVIWLLAIGGSIVPFFVPINSQLSPTDYLYGYIPTALVMLVVIMLTQIKRHESSLEECFIAAILLGVASWWMPSILFLVVPMVVYLYVRNLLEPRGGMAVFIGFSLVAIWMAVLSCLSLVTYPLSLTHNLWIWIPVGAFLFAYIVSTIARRILRVR